MGSWSTTAPTIQGDWSAPVSGASKSAYSSGNYGCNYRAQLRYAITEDNQLCIRVTVTSSYSFGQGVGSNWYFQPRVTDSDGTHTGTERSCTIGTTYHWYWVTNTNTSETITGGVRSTVYSGGGWSEATLTVEKLGDLLWLRDGGIWRQTKPFLKVGGVWKPVTARLLGSRPPAPVTTLLAPGASIVPFVGQLVNEGDNLGLPYWNAETSEFKTNNNESGIVYSSTPIDFSEIEKIMVAVDTLTSWKGGLAPAFFITSAKPEIAKGATMTVVDSWLLPENVSSTGTHTNVKRTISMGDYKESYYIGIVIGGAGSLPQSTGKALGITISCTKNYNGE